MRMCINCGESFSPTGKGSRCVPCRRVWDREWRARRKAAGNPVVSTPTPPEWRKEWMSHPEQKRRAAARAACRRAIKSGRLVKQGCAVCGSRAEPHHHDYSKPLDVRWLCHGHHAVTWQKAEGRA